MPASFSLPPTPPSVALVTGASDRIGAVIAERLAADGHAVVVHYRRNSEGAEAVRDRIRGRGGRAETVIADLADRHARAGLIDAAGAAFGTPTILINNASLYEPDQVADLDEALWDAHFAVHVEAPVFLARDFAARLGTRQGNIVNVIDERVLYTSPGHFSYTLSKSALWTATRMLAQSLAPNIRVNAVGPGPVLPHAGQSEEQFLASLGTLPLGRHAGPEAIADGVAFLLSAAAMTGQMLALDGGRHLDYSARRAPTPRR